MYRHLLVALGNGDHHGAVVGKVVDFARAVGARISFLPTLSNAAPSSPHVPHTASAAFKHQGAELPREMLAKAEAVARALGVACSSVAVSSDGPYPLLAQVAASRQCDLVALFDHGAGGAHWKTLASAIEAGLTTMVFPGARPAQSADQERTIKLLRTGQETLSMVLHLWLRLLDVAESRRMPADQEAMEMMAGYLQSPAASRRHDHMHQPLFRCLRERTEVVNAELEELERQHVLDTRLIATLNANLGSYAAGDTGLRELKAVVSAYASFTWQHAGREEGVIIPAAQRYLREDDWTRIVVALEQGGHDISAISEETARLWSIARNAAALQ